MITFYKISVVLQVGHRAGNIRFIYFRLCTDMFAYIEKYLRQYCSRETRKTLRASGIHIGHHQPVIAVDLVNFPSNQIKFYLHSQLCYLMRVGRETS